MSSFANQYLSSLIIALIPFGIGTLLIGFSPIVSKYSEKLALYVASVGVIISMISFTAIINNIAAYVGQFV